MEFRERTTKQISAAIERMLASKSEHYSGELESFRTAIDRAVQSLEEAVSRHVARVVERARAEGAATHASVAGSESTHDITWTDLTELREYATMLVNEIKHVYEADVVAGAADDSISERLRENLRCARQIYAQRVVEEGPVAAGLLEEQLRHTVHMPTPFARDLSAILERYGADIRTGPHRQTLNSEP
ncbi:MAG: hypothetical protein C5B57_01065 [Blastocatellia bacterium]|nr:MAG: hypothetical protein C5B57_01065 [Blastocatellia bacterium]